MIAFVLLLSVLLDRLLLRPITRVMSEREGAIHSARQLAESSHAKAQAAADELEARTRAARADVYRQMEDKRRAALERRMAVVAETRQQVERITAEAAVKVGAQATAARAQLDRDAEALAGSIVERVLGRKVS